MSKPLPAVWSLITDSWAFFTKTWNDTVKVSIWFLYGGLAYFVSSIIDAYMPELWAVSLFLTLGAAFFMIIGQLRLLKAVLSMEAGKAYPTNRAEIEATVRQFPSAFWVMILQALIVLAGTIFLILPGIYLSILLTFSTLIFLAYGKRGTHALQASRELVTGRWWATFGRLLLGGIVFGIGVGIIAGIAALILTLIARPLTVGAMAEGSSRYVLFQGSLELFQAVIQAAFMPLFVAFQVKMFRALERTR
jgi:hypothetical protein